ncbi:MAG: carboxypeptidase regulatory-like domain-containing protein [Bacteroidota bacterium]
MARTIRYLFVLLFIGIAGSAFAQSGAISGKITDEKNEAVIGAVVQAYQGGIASGGGATDMDGNFTIKPISPGRYTVKIFYTGYDTVSVTGIIVSPDKTTEVDQQIKPKTNTLAEAVVVSYRVPLIDKYAEGGHNTITSEQLEKMPTRNTSDVASTTAGVYQARAGAALNISGARSSGTQYIIDGIVVRGTNATSPAPNTVDQIEVITSGLSAKYGDATGGVINITTKGVSSEMKGDLLVEHSFDGYNHNMASGTISGPIYKKKMADGSKVPLVGFQLGGEYISDDDNNPNYNPVTVLKSDVLERLRKDPIKTVATSSGTQQNVYGAEFVNSNDLTTQLKRPNANVTTGVVNGKLDFHLADNLKLTAGGSFNYSSSHQYYRSNSIFAPDASPNLINYTGRAYVRLTQRFGKNGGEEKDKTGLISNAYYSLQADFQRDYGKRQDPNFKQNIFDYYYVGKFDQKYQPFYQTGVDSVSGKTAVRRILLDLPTSLTYTRSELNPILANYTTDYYNLAGNTTTTNLYQVRNGLGLMNGDAPNYVYSSWANIGQTIGYYAFSQSDQYAFNIDASFDFKPGKTVHAIGFGMYYQQRIDRNYYAQSNLGGANSLWSVMRLLVNKQLTLDMANPVYVINGKQYNKTDILGTSTTPPKVALSPYDTVLYNRIALPGQQSTFDSNLRRALGLPTNGLDMLNVDNIDPSVFSLKMFAPDELLNSGNPYVGYNGYTPYGETLNGQVNFNDFFTQKDARGNYTRPIGAFRPNYIAGYLLDQFQFKDILFNVGVRIERYDANTKVLKDPYSLYPVYTVGAAKGLASQPTNKYNNGVTPSNMSSSAVIYVDDNTSSAPQVVGYRMGDDWYDPYGRFIEDPRSLKVYSNGRDAQPFLQKTNGAYPKISDATFDPNGSFTDYTPQISVMPRIAFTFPISTVAKFYAHYDVIVMRPTTGFATPYDYYYLQQNANNIINNNDLKPEKTFDYEVGFQQQLSKVSSVKLAAFYKERKDMIQVRAYLNAWPTDYYTYGNRDFSSTKGMTLTYDLRRLGNIRMNVAYTLQFAEGTGSSENSGNTGSGGQISANGLLQTFIAAGTPNLRFPTALDYDTRHSIVASIDYRYDEGEGPVVAGKHILENAGINLLVRARSGEPWTKLQAPVNTVLYGNTGVVDGLINSSTLPWHYGIDLRIDKDFTFNLGKKHPATPVKPGKMLGLNAYLSVTNVFNTQDILGVYGYTGRPDDNGFLTSPNGVSTISQQTNAVSYQTLYAISMNDPSKLNLPRRINFGLQFNF